MTTNEMLSELSRMIATCGSHSEMVENYIKWANANYAETMNNNN